MAGVQFDRESAGRISNTVRTVERGLGIPTKRKRRALAGLSSGDVVLVRLLEAVPAAGLAVSTDYFYSELRRLAENQPVNTLSEGDLEAFTAELEAVSGEVIVGSGWAFLCSFEPGENAPYIGSGAFHYKALKYSGVVRVFNMHPTGFNVADQGGIFGNEAGSLGNGFCNAEVGPDGELWLLGADRKIFAQTTNLVNELAGSLIALDSRVSNIVQRLIDDYNIDVR